MLRSSHELVNVLRSVMRQHPALAAPANDRHYLCIRGKRSKIQPPQAAPARNQAPQAQTCCGYVQCDSAIHLEFQPQGTLRRAAARERLLQTLVLAPLSISSDAIRESRSPRKMFLAQTAVRMRRLARPRRSRQDSAAQLRRQTRGYIRGSSRVPRAYTILPSPRPGLLLFPKRVRPIPSRTKSTEANASASCCARRTKHKTSSRTDSRRHIHSAEQKKTPSRISEKTFCAGRALAVAKTLSMHHFSIFDYCRLARQLAIGEDEKTIAPWDRFAAAKRQTGQRYTPKDFRADGRVR
jgi:hypothetical protein